MKPLIYLALLIVISSCKQNEKKSIDPVTDKSWSQDSIRNYFKDSISHRNINGRMGQGDSLNDFDKFSKYILAHIKAKNITDPFILGFDENYIDTTKIDTSKKWFRISVNPVFRTPYCLILEKTGNTSTLTLKMTDGRGGYESGFLNFVSLQQTEDSFYLSISKRLHQLKFWDLKEDTTCGRGFDGENWTFEAIENGKYNIQTRWHPLRCGDSTTKELAKLCIQLRYVSQFKDYLQVRAGVTKKEIDDAYPDK